MSKYSQLLFSLFSISTAAVMADNCSPPRPACERPCVEPKPCEPKPVCPPKPKCKMPCPTVCGEPQGVTTEPQYVITPPFGPKVENGADFYLSADFIWWKTHIGGMEYAYQGVKDTGLTGAFVTGATTSASRGKIAQPNSHYHPGFKVGVGLVMDHDGWDLFAEWTWLRAHHHNGNHGVSAKTGKGLANTIPLWFPNPAVNDEGNPGTLFLTHASAKWKHHFNVVDLELGRKFFISKRLTLRPHFGLKGAWIRDKLKIDFDPLPEAAQSAGSLIFADAEQSRTQKMWGVGIRGGLDTVWHFDKHWGVYGDFALTTLWSDFKTKMRDSTRTAVGQVPSNTNTSNLNVRETVKEVVPVLEMGLGLTYMTWFNCDSYMFEASVGWENQVWGDFNHFTDLNRQGNLSTQGLTVNVLFAF